MKVKDVIRKGRGVRRGSGLDEVDAEILVGSSACQNVVGSAIRADSEAQLVEIEGLEREASTGRLEREILKCKVERMQRSISLQSLVDDWLGLPTTKALNKKIINGIDNEYHACAKDVRMTASEVYRWESRAREQVNGIVHVTWTRATFLEFIDAIQVEELGELGDFLIFIVKEFNVKKNAGLQIE
ncbi:unnamed protein product [Sphagnum troendelagicum]|uniref:Uncharacterized protein n=1 Tax=Sphagnum troendelagicum TaxID=128251 RepID=A0ABP0U466_9BRYO